MSQTVRTGVARLLLCELGFLVQLHCSGILATARLLVGVRMQTTMYQLLCPLFFTARCTIVQSAVLGAHVVRLSVRLSVCLSVTLVDCDHIVWKSWKLIARPISPTPSLFGPQTPST